MFYLLCDFFLKQLKFQNWNRIRRCERFEMQSHKQSIVLTFEVKKKNTWICSFQSFYIATQSN
jgi:hypothetical protein